MKIIISPNWFVFVLILLSLGCQIAISQPAFDFPGGFSYVINTHLNEVFDITPDGTRAVVLTPSETGPTGASQVVIIDPTTGFRLDTKITGRGEVAVKFAVLDEGIKVIVLTNDFGNKYITIYDMNSQGLLTQRAFTQLNNNPGISIEGSNIVYSSKTRTGFVSLSSGSNRLIAFNLDTGAVLQTLTVPVSTRLSLYEDSSRRILVSGINQTLLFIDFSNPDRMQELGRVTLPGSGAFSGTWELSPVFSLDGNYVFVGNGFSLLSAIQTDTRQIVGTLNNARYRVNRLKIFESQSGRFLALRALEDGGNALKGFALIDASDPANLSVINEIVLGEKIFAAKDFALSHNGTRLFVASFAKLTKYSIPELRYLGQTNLTAFDAVRLATFGSRERIFGAWLNRIYSIPNSSNTVSNFDLDLGTDIGTFRPSDGKWQWLNSSDGTSATPVQFGQSGDRAVPADYDGDGKTDLAVYRQVSGRWQILESSSGQTRIVNLGNGSDIPVPSDYDGDGKTDLAIFRKFPNRWLILQSSDSQIVVIKSGFGHVTPIVGDYDGDSKSDLMTFFNGVWTIRASSGPLLTVNLGSNGDIPITGDFDYDLKTDIAVYSPSTSTWKILQSLSGFFEVQFGEAGDLPVPADYDGDGKTDIAVYRRSPATWQILQSSTNSTLTIQFGDVGDQPLTVQH